MQASLSQSGLRSLLRGAEEDATLEEARENLCGGFDQPRAVNAILAGMLLGMPHELPLPPDFRSLPGWLLEDYLRFLLEMPPVFHRIGESAAYLSYLEKVTTLIERAIAREPQSPLADRLAEAFYYGTNFTQAYFNGANLRELFRRRARIIEAFLERNGCRLDYAFPPDPARNRKIRAGLLARHFSVGTETVSILTCFEYLDRGRFTLTLFSLAVSGCPMEQYARGRADGFVALPGGDIMAHVARIRAADLDVMLSGTNVTATSTLAVALSAHRLARLQVGLMCSPVSTGFRNVDLMIASRADGPEPSSLAAEFNEQLVFLDGPSHCGAYHRVPEPTPAPLQRAQLALPNDAVVFFSGAAYHKIIPELPETWAEILSRVLGSCLVLAPYNQNWSAAYAVGPSVARMEKQMADRGVAPWRLRILALEQVSKAVMQALISVADVYLDSHPYSGAVSMLDPLLAGCPAVAWQGGTFRSGMGAAMLRTLGPEDHIAHSREEYIRIATELATTPERRAQVRRRLQAEDACRPFLDTRASSRRWGDALASLCRERGIAWLGRAHEGGHSLWRSRLQRGLPNAWWGLPRN